MKDVQSLRDHFERFSQKYRSQTAFSQMYIKFLFANLLKDIYDEIPGEGEKQLNTKIDQLYRSFDFVQVTDLVSDSINRLEKAFQEERRQVIVRWRLSSVTLLLIMEKK